MYGTGASPYVVMVRAEHSVLAAGHGRRAELAGA